jgi:nucleoside-diphosphate-sugar epimerase
MLTLITGGAGFIGSHLVERRLAAGDHVVVLDNFVSGRSDNLAPHPRLSLISGDLSDPAFQELAGTTFDLVFNLAAIASPVGYARRPLETLRVNAQGVLNALDLARASGARFVQASTSEVYGDPLAHPQPESYWGNVNPVGTRACYVEGKRYAEALVTEYVRVHGLDGRIARIFNTYGPRSRPDDGRVVPTFCMQALRGAPLTIFGDGMQTRSFCFVDDLIDGLDRLATRENLGGEIVNLGNPVEITMLDFASRVIAATGSSSEIVHCPLPGDDPARRCPDITRAERLLDWRPRVSLEDGLARTVADLRRHLLPG